MQGQKQDRYPDIHFIDLIMPFLYGAVEFFAWYSCKLFFRDITVVSEQNIPTEGATIIYGNHNNQFVDGMLLMNAVPRPISFVAAAKSMRRPLIGHLLKGAGAIPVERPQDMKRETGPGTLTDLVGNKLMGHKTKFSKLTVGTTLHIEGSPQLKIKQIISDTEAQVEGEGFELKDANKAYKYLLKLDFHELYESVWTSLKNGQCIGIYPQGGSHDRLELLPLKAGICIMALGAMEKYNIPVKLVPCGFNYYNPHQFRSKAILEFGPAYQIPMEMVQLYKTDKKKAISILLDNVHSMLKSVTITFHSYDELFALYTCRELYAVSSKRHIDIRQKLQLNRRFAKGYTMIRQDPKYNEQYGKLLRFAKFVQLTGIKVTKEDYIGSQIVDFVKLFFFLTKCILRSIIALPGVILMGPTTSLIVYLSQKERVKCLKASKVKKYGNDVVGSYKILLSTILMPLTCAGHSFLLFYLLQRFGKYTRDTNLKMAIGLFLLQPIYALLFVKSYDSFNTSWQKLKIMFLRLFKPNIYQDFNKSKKQIQAKVMDLVEEVGSKVVQNFAENRILKKEDIHRSETQFNIFDNQSQSGSEREIVDKTL